MKKIFLILVFLLTSINFLSGKELTDLIKEGVVYLNSGEYEKSIKIFEEVKKNAPENSDIYYYLGEAYFRKGDTQKAFTNLQKAIEINPQNQVYHYTLAHIYLSQNKNKEAIETLDKIIKISPLSIYGKEAKELKEKLEKMGKDVELTKKWEKIEIEEKKKKEEEKKAPQQSTEGGEIKKEEKVPIDKIVKRIKFGTEDIRKTSSGLILNYSSSEISQVIKDIIEVIKKEKDKEIRKNLIFALRKVNLPEVIDTLLEIIRNEKELYEIKLVSFDSLENIKSEKIVPEIRDILSKMVDKREREREEAKRNLQQISQQIDTLVKKRDILNSEVEKMSSRLGEVNNALGVTFEEQFEGTTPRLSEKEKQKLNDEKRTLEERIRKNTNELQKIEKDINELSKAKNRYETLLALREKRVDISNLGSSQIIIQETTPQEGAMGEPGTSQPEIITYSQTELDEEKNEIILSIRMMNFLANMRDKESLQVIKKSWKEFGVPGLSIYYYIALGKLGEYTDINTLVSRLKRNYPQESLAEEINIRKNIIEVLGEYIKIKSDEEIKELIEYLAEESEYPQIKDTAKKTLAKTGSQ